MDRKKYIVFVSETNACRSILAEAFMKRHGKGRFESLSFGISASRVHYLVREYLEAQGFNMNYYFSKVYDVIENQPMDLMVVMHPDITPRLPLPEGKIEKIEWNFEDPTTKNLEEPALRKEIEKLAVEIEKKVKDLIARYRNED